MMTRRCATALRMHAHQLGGNAGLAMTARPTMLHVGPLWPVMLQLHWRPDAWLRKEASVDCQQGGRLLLLLPGHACIASAGIMRVHPST